ncbi:TraH family protein [Ancylobacter oerskovii]|uniref:TraH family protein n=1 Tax=Ancylobacter oerskovii TaxID=459519 RepID=A0ABW4Z5F4_9HYPH|nr:TraH family protein [Ancylobacter oerskovii]MBS7546449.1 conjugal transfer protein TraH [Ancylobacter oerskovii]
MVDAALIKHCADPALKPAIVERFIAQGGSSDPLTVTIRAGDRVILVPRPTTTEAAMELIRRHVGRHVVRVGITQMPVGLDIASSEELKPDLVDPCANIRIGTALFGKVYRIVVKWYGASREEAVEDAILAWRTGTFEGIGVFSAPDPGSVASQELLMGSGERAGDSPDMQASERAKRREQDDPNMAGTRVDLLGIDVGKP